MDLDGERRARVALSFLARPGDPVLGAALRTRTASEVLALVTGADADSDVLLAGAAEDTALAQAVERWRDRLGEIPGTARLAARQDSGLRLIMPGDSEWPTQLDDLGDARPLLLWLRGAADLRLTCVNSVAVVGARGHGVRQPRGGRDGRGPRRARHGGSVRRRVRYKITTALTRP